MPPKVFDPEVCPIREKFATTRRELSESLIERDGEVDLVLTALVAREHVLIVGQPGSAKSLLLDSLMGWMHGKKFSILLNRFTTPEEVLGPISVAATFGALTLNQRLRALADAHDILTRTRWSRASLGEVVAATLLHMPADRISRVA